MRTQFPSSTLPCTKIYIRALSFLLSLPVLTLVATTGVIMPYDSAFTTIANSAKGPLGTALVLIGVIYTGGKFLGSRGEEGGKAFGWAIIGSFVILQGETILTTLGLTTTTLF